MNFLTRLKELLGDLPQEEREEAVRYYEDYFADAGPLEEARILKELISPEDVAEKIRAGCDSREKSCEEKASEEISDRVLEDMGTKENEFVQDDIKSGENPWETENMEQEDAHVRGERMRMGEAYAQDYQEEEYPHNATVRTKTYFSPVIFLLALLIGLPILCPVLFVAICMMGGFFVGFSIGGVVLVAGGVALIGNAFTLISIGSGLACLLSGGGLILTALGILFIVFAVNCAFRAIPALFRGIRNIVLSLRGRWA